MLDRAAVGLDCRDCGHRPHGADARPGIDVRCGEIVAASWSGSGPEPEHCECLDFGEVYKAHQRLLHEGQRDARLFVIESVRQYVVGDPEGGTRERTLRFLDGIAFSEGRNEPAAFRAVAT